jgi:hypothetical protein
VTPSNESPLRPVLASVADRMVADLKASGVAKHGGSKGTVREAQLLSNYLGKYLPRNVRAEHSGEVVAVNGERSQQCDILIVDPSTPPFWDEEDYRIVPAECVYGVIEVKSSLDSKELKKAWKLIADVKALPKTAYSLDEPPGRTRLRYGQALPYIPTVGMVFAYDGISLDTLCDTFDKLALKYPCERWVDSIWVLNKGYIIWSNPFEPGRGGYMAWEATAQEMLLPLTAHLHQHFGTAWMPDFNIMDYLTNVSFGTVVRETGETPDPPP